MRMIALALGMILSAGCSAPSQSSDGAEVQASIDEWETPGLVSAAIEGCEQTPTKLVQELKPSVRDQSIAMLADVSAFHLSDEDAARLIDVSLGINTSLASTLVATDLEELRARRHRAVVESRDSWSGADEVELASLSESYQAGSYQDYRPYLVRAVAKNEATGHFYASMCEGDLYVEHGSLGHSVPPSTRVPLLVFLSQPPNRVFVTWSMAK